MLLTFHTLAGAAIASQVQSPLVAWPLAFTSHFVLDLMPHWDFFTNGVRLDKLVKTAIAGDVILSFLIGIIFAVKTPGNAFNILGACFLACLPDILEAPHFFMKHEPWWTKLDLKIQHRFHHKLKLPWGLFLPVVITGVSLFFLLN
ncbi:MAG: hypothetical protein NT141_01175 [candidate division WWE3 bacterium]|nr:hypothetical protein [candidate division WWE3 bacterium]